MIPSESLIAFTAASILLGLAPGPDNIFVLTQSALHGRKNGIFVTLGLCTGLIFHTVAVGFGVAAIFQVSVLAFTILKIIGAAYLTYLAWQAFRASASCLEDKSVNQLSASQLYRRGIIMNITNPKVSIFFLAFLPQFASPASGPIAVQIMILGLIFIIMTFLVFSGIAMIADSLGNWLSRSPQSSSLYESNCWHCVCRFSSKIGNYQYRFLKIKTQNYTLFSVQKPAKIQARRN